jgi:hypothetical protein
VERLSNKANSKVHLGLVYQEKSMIQEMRVKLARWILGKHCPCYQMGYHNLVDFQQKSADRLSKAQDQMKAK